MKKITKSYHRSKISFWNAINTEWNAIKNDKAIIGVFLSIAFLVLVAYTFVYSNQVVEKVPVAIINQDASRLSRDYIAMLNSGDGLEVKTSYTDLQEAKVAYYENTIKGIIIIPNNFEKNIKSGKQVTITTYSDASNMLFYKKVLGTVTTINGYFNAAIIIKKDVLKGMTYKQAVENYTPIKSVNNSLFNISGGYATYLIPILTALIVQLVLLMGVGLINGTRNEDRTTKSHFPRLAHKGGTIPVLLGKAILYTCLFLIIIPIQIGIVYTLFSIPIRSSLITVYIFIIPYVFSVVFLGLVISSFFKRREDSLLFIVLTSIPALMLSGLSFPPENFSQFYQILAQLIPSTHGIEGFVKLTQMKASFPEIMSEWYKLWGLTLIYFIMASFLLKLKVKKINSYSK